MTRTFAISAAVAGLVLATGTAADAVMFTVDTEYTSTGTPPTQIDVRTTAVFTDDGVIGVGTEKVQIEQLEFRFTRNASTPLEVQSPTITIAPPDLSGNFPQGTFLAIFTDGIFDFMESEVGIGGFAQPPAIIRPTGGPFAIYVALTMTGMLERIGFSSSFAEYELLSQTVTTPGPLNPVPLPATFWLFAMALVNLAVIGVTYRRRA